MKTYLFILSLLISSVSFAQEGGNNTYEFLNLVPSARAAGLGGTGIANPSDDASLIWQNPALLRRSMHSQLQLSFADYFDKISFGEVGYAHDFSSFGTTAATFHFINYGSFNRTDEAATDMGTYSAGEYSLGLSYGKALDSLFYIGATVKGVYSDLEIYNSVGILADVGGIYLSEDKTFCAAIVAHNIGRQITTYNDVKEKVPFQMQLGLTKRLPKAPFRFGFTYQNLEKFNITYEDPNVPDVDPLTGEKNDKKISFLDKFVRHIVLNTELLLSKNFNVRLGYNFKRRAELSIEDKRRLVGLTGGVGIKISKFRVDYARAVYHIKGASNQFTLGMRLSDFKR